MLKVIFRPPGRLFAQVLILLWLISSPLALATSFDHSKWNHLLQQYVYWPVANQVSQVDYHNFDQLELQHYLDSIAAVSRAQFNAWPDNEQLAFLINAYNAYTIQYILSVYPNLNSIRDLGNFFQSPWKKKRFALFGEKLSLDRIEHELIRPVYQNPWIHAAVVCAATSCPPLQSYAYNGEQLPQQLESAFRNFLSSDKNTYEANSNTLRLSAIFKWYRQDFGSNLNLYLSHYAKELQAKPQAIRDASISYYDYDWSLNAYESD